MDRLAPDQEMREVSPLNIGGGVTMKGGKGDRKFKQAEAKEMKVDS